MTKMRWTYAAMMLMALSISGCVELTGQRLSWRYDAQADQIDALLFYDGIHDTDDVPQNGLSDLQEFVKNGEIMLADWFGHLFVPVAMKQQLEKPDSNLSPAEKQLIQQALKSVHTHAIGHYRDAEGHIGAAQAITISEASKLVAAFNAWFTELVIADQPTQGQDSYRTRTLMLEATKMQHVWMKLDGNSIVWTTPVDRDEWAKTKAGFFVGGMSEWGQDNDMKSPDQQAARMHLSIRWMTQLLTSAPVSYTEQRGMVTIRLGDSDTASTLRYRVHDRYSDNLAEPVRQLVPTDVDAALAKYLLDVNHTPNGDLDAIIAFGPPEQQVAALLAAARGEDTNLKDLAVNKLVSWAKAWNADHGYPAAPENMPQVPNNSPVAAAQLDVPAYLKSWDTWLKQMACYPTDVVEAAKP